MKYPSYAPRSSTLAVIRTGSVFPHEMFVEQGFGYWGDPGIQAHSMKGHPGGEFQDDRVIEGLFGCSAPGERGMGGNENGGDAERIELSLSEAFHDEFAGVPFVITGEFFGREQTGDRDGAVEIVGV